MIEYTPLYIFDLDGTLALINHRRHFVDGDLKDWRGFFKACVDDVPNVPVIRLMTALVDDGADVWVWSGRSDEVRAETEEWLHKHTLFYAQINGLLRMRVQGDHQPDDRLKLGWYEQMKADDKNRLVMIFDDRDRMVKMWREQGLTCLQVEDGDF